MASLSGMRNKLQTKIFDKFGSTATLESINTNVLDKWGDGNPTYSAGTSITVVPYNYIVSRLNFQPFADLQENEVALVVKYDTSLNEKDKITYDSTVYMIVEIEKYMFDNGIIAQNVRLVEVY